MDDLKIELKLLPVVANVAEYQEALANFVDSLKADGIKISPRYYVRDAIDGGGGLSGEFTLIVTALTVAGSALGAWFTSRYGKKVKLKIGDVEAEAPTVEEVERLLRQVPKLQRRFDSQNKP